MNLSVTFTAVVELPKDFNENRIYAPLWASRHRASAGDMMTFEDGRWWLTPFAGCRDPVGPSKPVAVPRDLHAHLMTLNEKQGIDTRVTFLERAARRFPPHLRLAD